MDRKDFEAVMQKHAALIARIKESAHELHRSVNQTYSKGLPYSFHLDMVANVAATFGHLVCTSENDVVPLLFGAYYHDSIEDARLTYNDVMKTARSMMGNDEQALTATEIVYALTNDKGRNRAERAGEKYYAGIRATPYAPFVKLCDRFANISFSCQGRDATALRMKEIYKKEVPHFLESINPHSDDPRFGVPPEVVERLAECLIDELEREEKRGEG
jgi:(p)ppGpp synthase/HD superfamily hydrolase